MRSNSARVLAGIGVVVVAVVLLLVLKDDGESASEQSDRAADTAAQAPNGAGQGKEAATAAVPTVVVEDGEPVGGIRTLTYKEGDRIRFKVESDTSDEVHVHGYDIEKQVKAGGSVVFDFPATIEGGFEAEMHHGGQIAELIVNP
jgi:hypothetical protein